MSKVKQWAEDTAEKSVDKIILQVKQNLITKETATTNILGVENVNMLGIDENNVDEVLFYAKEDYYKNSNAVGVMQ